MILALSVLYCALHVLGWMYPAVFWGTDQLHYYPTSILISFVLASLTTVVVASRTAWGINLDLAIARLIKSLQERPFVARWSKVLLVSLFLLLAFVFRAQSHHLGDSSKWFDKLELALLEGGGLSSLATQHIPFFEPLDFIIHLHVYRLGHQVFAWAPSDAYAWLSYIAGAFYVSALWGITAFLSGDFLDRLTFMALLVSLGSVQLFFGYGESYTLVTLSSALYVWFALRCLRGHSLIYPTLWFLSATALHVMALSLFPSWLYLLWHRKGRPLENMLQKPQIYLPAITLCPALALYMYYEFYPNSLPLWKPQEEGKYALLSLPHFMLLANATLLLSPFGIVWGLSFLLTEKASTPATSFFGCAALGTSSLIFLHDAYLGGRDWDLMSYPCLFWTLWGILCLKLSRTNENHLRETRLVVLPLMAFHTILWIGINSSPERATSRLGFLLENSNQARHYRAFTLGHYYLNIQKKNFDQAVGWLREAIAYAPPDSLDPGKQYRSRYQKLLGLALTTQGKYRESIEVFETVFANRGVVPRSPNDISLYHARIAASFRLGEEEYRKGDIVRAEEYWKKALEYYLQVLVANQQIFSSTSTAAIFYNHFMPTNARLNYNLGILYYKTHHFDRAVQAFSRAILTNPRYALAHSNLGTALRGLGKLWQAEQSYQNAIHIQPDNPVFYHNLGGLKLEQNDKEAAITA